MSEPTASEIVRLNKEYSLFDWKAQAAFQPTPATRAKGVYFCRSWPHRPTWS